MADKQKVEGWQFTDSEGTFELVRPDQISHLYFPLVNEALMMSSITPKLHGDIKIDHHHFLTPPVSVFDLHSSRASRNFFIKKNDSLWSAAGNGAGQDHEQDETQLEAGILWHRIIRKNEKLGVQVRITNFVPQTADQVELMQVELTNLSKQPISFTPIAAIPLFGRSADSLRDHRHVTSLLNRVAIDRHGVILKPVMSFDERGHNLNNIEYAVFGSGKDGSSPKYIYPCVDAFIGEGGSLDHPLIDFDEPSNAGVEQALLQGGEAFGGLRFEDVRLGAGETCNFHLVMAIGEGLSPEKLVEQYGSATAFEKYLEDNKTYWAEKLDRVRVYTGDARRDNWSRWVALQPILRRLMGNSFLPYHDYGRGGRGWRDLWQDALGLLLLETDEISDMMHANFAGIRMDGSNATIIGSQPGEFKADRNEIPRVWMDHGVWPLKTLDLYLGLTGDYPFLLREQTYFKDRLTHRTKQKDHQWCDTDGHLQKTVSGKPYLGSIFEHLLIQHLTAFFNAGEHNCLLLEGGDWNDGLDMAHQRGESVAFSAFYAANLRILAGYAQKLIESGLTEIRLAGELAILLDRCFERVDYDRVSEKNARLWAYFDTVAGQISDNLINLRLEDLREDLEEKSAWLSKHIQEQEWINCEDGTGWFNGYYDNEGIKVEGITTGMVRMTLTGQVFPTLSNVASDSQIQKMVKAADRYLFDKNMGGYRLNTDFKDVQMSLGRAFGFAFGHKENGAMFSHMAMMFAYALYQRGYPEEGHFVIDTLYQHCQNFSLSKMYPGIPEYIGPDGRGYYFYLTGSASWYLFTLITQVFGIRGVDGDLVVDPKLVPAQFDQAGLAAIHTHFSGRKLVFEFSNPDRLPVNRYRVLQIRFDNAPAAFDVEGGGVRIKRNIVEELDLGQSHKVLVELGEK